MTTATTTQFDIATGLEPTSKAVWVQNISLSATDKAVKDFFTFCGTIEKFELKKVQDTQEALIIFDKDSAANTARLLSNAVIVDGSVQVKSYYADQQPATNATPAVHSEQRPATTVISELLANGYTFSEGIVKRGLLIDEEYFRVTKTLTTYFYSAKSKAEELEEKYKVTEKIKQFDSKLQVSENANAILNKSMQLAGVVLATPPGQLVVHTVDFAKEQAIQVAQETRALVDEKHSRQLADKTAPIPTTAPPNANSIKVVQTVS